MPQAIMLAMNVALVYNLIQRFFYQFLIHNNSFICHSSTNAYSVPIIMYPCAVHLVCLSTPVYRILNRTFYHFHNKTLRSVPLLRIPLSYM